jgi:hypothetical protein
MAEDLIVGLTTDEALRRCFTQVRIPGVFYRYGVCT